MRNHSDRMNSCICAARTVKKRLAGKQLRERLFDFLLNSDPDLLRLPTLVGSAVVSNRQLESKRLHCSDHPDNSATKLPPPFYRPFPSASRGAHSLRAKIYSPAPM